MFKMHTVKFHRSSNCNGHQCSRIPMLGLLLGLCSSRGEIGHKSNSPVDGSPHECGTFWIVSQGLKGEFQLVEHCPAVRIPPGLIPKSQESVVKEGGDDSGPSCEDHEDAERHEEDFVEGNHPQDVPGLELNQADQHTGSPPGILSKSVQQCEGL